jgi:ATP-dependent exoDNAse (exonuclease V) beta subunit
VIRDAFSETTLQQQSDEAGRARFVAELDRNFSVLACAGAGKTTAVVDRIVNLAERYPERLSRLVVVTYTNSAANEFKRRVFAHLITKRNFEAKNTFSRLERTFFGTIHSFCFRLVRQYQNELGLPADLSIAADQSDEAIWQEFCHRQQAVSDKDEPLLQQLLRFCTWQEVLDLARTFDAEHPVVRPSRETPPVPDISTLNQCVVPRNSQGNRKLTIEKAERTLTALATDDEFVPLPAASGSSKPLLEAFSSAMGPLYVWVEEASAYFAGQLAAGYRRECRSRGLLTFDDLINLAGDLLTKPAVLDEIRRQQYSVLLDEAQDTAAQLFRVLVEITRPTGASIDSWPGNGEPPAEGRFSMVGDPRQAIYDHAGVEQYSAICDAFRLGDRGELVELSVTQRCAGKIVECVNQIFSAATEQSFPDLLAAPVALDGHVFHLPLAPRSPESPTDVSSVFAEEVRQVVDWLKTTGKEMLGIHSWHQVAILAPQHAWLNFCVEALRRAGLDHSYYNQQISWSARPAFTWPVSLLYTLLYPWDRFERFGVLREIFAISDVVLARLTEGRLGESVELDEANGVLRRLEKMVGRRANRSLAGLLEEVIRGTELLQRLEAIGQPSADLSIIRQKAYEADQQGLALPDWLDQLIKNLEEDARSPGSTEDKIQLITCQSAKGLEWDIVIPVGLARPVETSALPYPRLANIDGRVRLIWNSGSPNARISLNPEAAALLKQRVLYVALTRARHALVLPFAREQYARNKGSFLQVVGAELDALVPNAPERLTFAKTRKREVDRGVVSLPRADLTAAVRASREMPNVIHPHNLVDDREAIDAGFEDGESAYLYGRWWHRWVEDFPWDSPDEAWSAFGENVPDVFNGRARQEVAKFLASPDLQQILKAGEWFQVEVPFSWPETDDSWTEGVIDLVIGTGLDETWIVDWKTNQPGTGESMEDFERRLRSTYLPQLFAYQAVLEKALGKRVTRLEVYSTVLGKFV